LPSKVHVIEVHRKEESMKDNELVIETADFVPLAKAVLCLDCERISRQAGGHYCPGCGSASVLNLAAILNPRSEVDEPARMETSLLAS
jgi:hypothetical protein